jgi:hypothetical protein
MRAQVGVHVITRAEVEKLGAVHAVAPTILSVYLTVPSDPGELSDLAARAGELIAGAESAAGGPGLLGEEDRDYALEMLAAGGRDWPGRTVGVFACADAGLLEALPLPCRAPDRAILGTRPHRCWWSAIIQARWRPGCNAPLRVRERHEHPGPAEEAGPGQRRSPCPVAVVHLLAR